MDPFEANVATVALLCFATAIGLLAIIVKRKIQAGFKTEENGVAEEENA